MRKTTEKNKFGRCLNNNFNQPNKWFFLMTESKQAKPKLEAKPLEDKQEAKAEARHEKVEERALTAAEIERAFKEYSVAEFFKKNRQMLGYTGKIRSLTTIVHEAVTNSLDACEDAKILPEITVEIKKLENGHYYVIVQDNGTGIPKAKIGQAFGQLLSGTKFAQRMQKRGQQGIGISYAVLFSQITTGKPAHVKTSTGDYKIFEADVSIDVKKNAPVVSNFKEYSGKFQGTRFEAEFAEVDFNKSEYSVGEYLRRTAIANPHAQITFISPDNEVIVFPRSSNAIPKKPKAVLPHPLGLTTSDVMDMASVSKARKISSFFTTEFSRFSDEKMDEIKKMLPNIDFERAPKNLQWHEAEAIVKCISQLKWISADASVLQPIGEAQLEKSLKNLLKPEQLAVIERKPKVFRGGIPFSVEAAIAYGGGAGTPANGGRKGEVLRFANRVPLLFDAGNCAITEAVKTIDWARYDLRDWENMPVSIFVHFVSVYVPYTGAGKLAVAAEDEIIQEIRFALMDCARQIGLYLHSLARAEEQEHRRQIFVRYIGEVAQALSEVTGKPKEQIAKKLEKIAKERTALLEAGGGEEEEELEEIERRTSKELREEGEEKED
ncbi:MAG: DNA topoisomerase VI subunit B [Candidatus Norongarragalinales archaeon]